MIAALLRSGTDQQLLAVKTIEPESNWIKLDAPRYITTIQFASQGHDLFLTHSNVEVDKDILMRWNLDTPHVPPKKIYEAHHLWYPTEVSPGQILVRSGRPFNSDKKRTHPQWVLLDSNNKETPIPGATDFFRNPSILRSGFFWINNLKMGKNEDGHPMVMSFPLPGGVAPVIPRELLDDRTYHLYCDRTGARCLRKHVLQQNGPYVYDVDVLYDRQQCQIKGVAGFPDYLSISPDGLAAVMSFATAYAEPRRIIVMKFESNSCEAKSVQYIQFIEQ